MTFPNPEQEFLETINQVGQQERTRIIMAREAFEEMHPKPLWIEPQFTKETYVEPTFNESFGLQAKSMYLAVIGAMGISLITVGLVLFVSAAAVDAALAASTTSPFLRWLANIIPGAFFFFSFAAELYAFSHGLAEGKKKGDVVFSGAALFAAFAIMSSAGLYRAFGISKTPSDLELFIQPIVTIILIAATGLGFPALVYFGSINIGVFDNQFELLKKEKFDEYQKRQDGRLAQFNIDRDADYNVYLGQLKLWQEALTKYWQKEFSGQVFGVERGKPSAPRSSSSNGKTHKPAQGDSTTEEVWRFLLDLGVRPSEVGGKTYHRKTPAAICDDMGWAADDRRRDNISVVMMRLREKEQKGLWDQALQA